MIMMPFMACAGNRIWGAGCSPRRCYSRPVWQEAARRGRTALTIQPLPYSKGLKRGVNT